MEQTTILPEIVSGIKNTVYVKMNYKLYYSGQPITLMIKLVLYTSSHVNIASSNIVSFV